MVKIFFNNKEYIIEKEKIKFILSRLYDSEINDNDILVLMEKFQLFDEDFLNNLDKI